MKRGNKIKSIVNDLDSQHVLNMLYDIILPEHSTLFSMIYYHVTVDHDVALMLH